MERRRMDAALLVLFLGHLATALEVPLDCKAHTPGTGQLDLLTRYPGYKHLIVFYLVVNEDKAN